MAHKGYIFRSLASVFEVLENALGEKELSELALALVSIVHKTQVSTLDLDKLRFLKQLASGNVLKFERSRAQLEPLIVKILKHFLTESEEHGYDEMYLSIDVLSKVLNTIHQSIFDKENGSKKLDSTVQGKMDLGFESKKGISPRTSRYSQTSRARGKRGSISSVVDVSETKTNVIVDSSAYWELVPSLLGIFSNAQQRAQGKLKPLRPKEQILNFAKVDMLVDTFACLSSVIYQASEAETQKFLAVMDPQSRSNFLISLLSSFKLIITDNQLAMFPESWVIMKLFKMRVSTHLIQTLKESLKCFFLEEGDFCQEVWELYFQLITALMLRANPDVENDKFTQKGRDALSQRFTEIRELCVSALAEMWESVSNEHLALTGAMIHLLPDMILHCGTDSENLALQIYLDLFRKEITELGTYSEVERYTFDILHRITNTSRDTSDKLFSSLILSLQHVLVNTDKGSEFYDHVTRLHSLLIALFQYPDNEIYEMERTFNVLDLLQYLDSVSTKRQDVYCQNVQYLIDMQVSLANFSEAGMAAYKLLQRLDWSEELMDPTGDWPRETSALRKERLYDLAISYFKQAEEWGRLIEVLDELKLHMQFVSLEYHRIPPLLKTQQEYFQMICEHDQFFPVYFRVCFYGKDLGNLDGTEFVFKGARLESNIDFMNRVKRKWPKATIQMSSDLPSPESIDKGAVISITTLTPASEAEMNGATVPRLTKQKVSQRIQTFFMHQNLRVFSYKKPVSRSKLAKPENEFVDLWALQTFIAVKDPFPSVQRIAPVIERKEVWLSPLDNAIRAVKDKNAELEDKINRAVESKELDLGPLSMTLNGMIDAAVNGGTGKYIEAFLRSKTLEGTPEVIAQQKELRAALQEQSVLLLVGLECFGRKCNDQLKGLYNHLRGNLLEALILTL